MVLTLCVTLTANKTTTHQIKLIANLKIECNYTDCGVMAYSICIPAPIADSTELLYTNKEFHVIVNCPEQIEKYCNYSKFKVDGYLSSKQDSRCTAPEDNAVIHLRLNRLTPLL